MRLPSRLCHATRLSLAVVGSFMLILVVLPLFAQGTKDNGIINFGQPSFTLPDTYQAHFALGQEAMQKGDLDQAIVEFSECVRIFKPYMGISKADISFDKRMADDLFFQPLSNTLVNLGHALRQNNNLDKAIETYTMAADVCPGCIAAHSSLGSALIAKAGALQVSAIATHFPQGNPSLSDEQSNLYRTAIAHLHVARQLDPQDTSSYINLSRALLRWGMRDGAVRQARSAVQLADDDPEAYLVLGEAMMSVGQMPAAADAFKRAASLSTGNSASYQAVIQNNIGTVASASGDWAAALEAYKKAAELDPGCADYANNVGVMLRNMGEKGWADTALRGAVTLNPTSVEQYMNLAAALRDKGDFKGAAEAYRAALRFDPNNAELWHQFGVALYSAAGPDTLIKRTATLLQGEPGKQTLQQAVAQVGMHFIRDRKLTTVMAADPNLLDVTPRVALRPDPWGRLSDESIALADALNFRPLCGGDRVELQNLLRNDLVGRKVIISAVDKGLVEVNSSGKIAAIPDEIGVAAMTAEEATSLIGFGAALNYSDALMCSVSALRRARELAPNDGLVANNLGKALYEAGAINEARGMFEKAIVLTPDVPEVWKNHGLAAGRLGDMSIAAASFNRAIELDKSDAEAYVLRGMACLQRAEFDSGYAMFNRGVMADSSDAPAMYYAGLTDLLKQSAVPLTNAAVKHARLTTPLGRPHYSARVEFIPMAAAEKGLGMIISANEKDPGLCKYFYYAGAELALPEAGGGVDIIHAVSANNALLPEWASAANNMGVAYAARGDWKNAERLLRLSTEDAPEYALAHYNLGRVLIADGRREAGEASLAKARNYAKQQNLPYYFAVAGDAGMRTASVGGAVPTPRSADMTYTMRNLLEAFDITESVW